MSGYTRTLFCDLETFNYRTVTALCFKRIFSTEKPLHLETDAALLDMASNKAKVAQRKRPRDPLDKIFDGEKPVVVPPPCSPIKQEPSQLPPVPSAVNVSSPELFRSLENSIGLEAMKWRQNTSTPISFEPATHDDIDSTEKVSFKCTPLLLVCAAYKF